MKIYIASSWKHKHGVMMLTDLLRRSGHLVISWIENCSLEENTGEDFVFEDWVKTPEADECFLFDVNGAMDSEILIYYGNAGKDACIELGAAYAYKHLANDTKQILALWSKGEDLGLMRKAVDKWFTEVNDLVDYINTPVTSYLSDDDDLPF